MRISENGLGLVKEFEGFSSQPYLDSGGVATQGWGHTEGVTMKSGSCTPQQADKWLQQDIENAEAEIAAFIKNILNQNQFDALTSLVFNIGPAPLKKTLGTMINAGNYSGAADQFIRWSHVNGQVSQGLLRRRQAERDLFMEPV